MVKQSDYIGMPVQDFLIGSETFYVDGSGDRTEYDIVIYKDTTLASLNRMKLVNWGGGNPTGLTRNGNSLYASYGSGTVTVVAMRGITSHGVSSFAAPTGTISIANDGTNLISTTGTTVSIHSGFTATVGSTFSLSATSLYVYAGDLYAVTASGDDFTIHKYDGISSTQLDSITVTYALSGGESGNSVPAICFVGDDLVTLQVNLASSGIRQRVRRYAGFTTTLSELNDATWANSGTKDFWEPNPVLESMQTQAGVVI